jgi:hypothetical protein
MLIVINLDERGHRLVVRNGRKSPRTILSGVGPIEVIQPRVDDRRTDENGVRAFRFTLKILPLYLRSPRRSRNWCPSRRARKRGAGARRAEQTRCCSAGPTGRRITQQL